MPAIRDKLLIACGIFRQELQAVLPDGQQTEIFWIDPALHADLPRLEKELKNALSGGAGKDIRLLIGNGCHPDIKEMAEQHGARLPPIRNCLEAFLGERARHLEEERTMIMTPWQSMR